MKTVLRIPFEPAPVDPSWLLKGHSGRKMDALEVEHFMAYQFERDHQNLISDFQMSGIPSKG
jgi:hypothetical protein